MELMQSVRGLEPKIKSDVAVNADMVAVKPGLLKVIKRNGQVAHYDPSKIAVAMTKAFLAVEGGHAAESTRVHELVSRLVNQMTDTFERRMPSGGTLHIEDIQDQVELILMREGEHKIARAYVLYREERRRARDQQKHPVTPGTIRVKYPNGDLLPVDTQRIQTLIQEASEGLDHLDWKSVQAETLKNLFDGVAEEDVNKALVMAARTRVEQDPDYSYMAARLLQDALRSESLRFLGVAEKATYQEMLALYPRALKAYVMKGIELELLDPQLAHYDLDRLGRELKGERDLALEYLGMQTLYDRYFIHHKGIRLELPQVFFMRVAMGLALNEQDKNARAIEFYHTLSSFDYMSSTPTLFNAGTLHSQLSSCYLTTVPDDLGGIYGAVRDNALLQKFAGGLGNDWTYVRGMNSHIKGTNGKSQGVIPFLKVANDTAVAVNQGGKRKGAVCAYLETWHVDIEEFLELRKNSGDDRRRTHDMNTANWVPDLFMERVMKDESWTLFTPNEVPDLHDLYGDAFRKAYERYESMAARGEIFGKSMPAKNLWRKMLGMLFETGHPWVTFKDPCNLRSPQQHVGVVHSSNLCTEITLNTSEDEIAVCNLGSISLPKHLNANGEMDTQKLKETVRKAVRMLDNVIDINYYAVPQARKSNLKHRPIGLGLMGFQDALYLKKIPYDTPEAVEFADRTMELISYYAIEASSELAVEKGSYESFEGSLWSQGILPIDSIKLVAKSRPSDYLDMDTSMTLDWATLRTRVRTQGMRNSNVMAIAPTATIANITGMSQSIEPTYQNLYVKSNLSGEFTVMNPYLVTELKARHLWDTVMVNDLKYFDGSVQKIDRIPADLKRLFATAFEVDARWLIDAASRRQKWIDQSQSLNLYVAEPSGKVLDRLYKYAWLKGLKTTYYLRTLGATSTEKSTIDKVGQLNAVKNNASMDIMETPKVCSILDPGCEACQ